jgi:hypothetical protein
MLLDPLGIPFFDWALIIMGLVDVGLNVLNNLKPRLSGSIPNM